MLGYLLVALLVAAGSAPAAPAPVSQGPGVVKCTARNAADGTQRECAVKIPAGAVVRLCDSVERAAGHCTLHRKGRLQAWTVGQKGAVCRLAKKKTDWRKRVAMKIDKATPPGAGSCVLFVALR